MPDGTPRPHPPARTNRPHYHVWIFHRNGRMSYRLARPFFTRQAARAWAMRHRPKDEWMIRASHDPKTAPKLT